MKSLPVGYVRLDQLKSGQIYNVYGVVKYYSQPKQNRRNSNYSMCVTITDPTKEKLVCMFFGRNINDFPKIDATGDVIRINRLEISTFQGSLQAKGAPGFSCIVLPRSKKPPYYTKPGCKVLQEDLDIFNELLHWSSDLEKIDATISKIFTLSDFKLDDYFDLVCQVLETKVVEDHVCVQLTVADGTRVNSETFQHVGSYGTDVLIFDDHFPTANTIKPGDYVKLTNLHAAPYHIDRDVYKRGAGLNKLPTIDLCLHRGTKFARGVTVLTANAPEVSDVKTRIAALPVNIQEQIKDVIELAVTLDTSRNASTKAGASKTSENTNLSLQNNGTNKQSCIVRDKNSDDNRAQIAGKKRPSSDDSTNNGISEKQSCINKRSVVENSMNNKNLKTAVSNSSGNVTTNNGISVQTLPSGTKIASTKTGDSSSRNNITNTGNLEACKGVGSKRSSVESLPPVFTTAKARRKNQDDSVYFSQRVGDFYPRMRTCSIAELVNDEITEPVKITCRITEVKSTRIPDINILYCEKCLFVSFKHNKPGSLIRNNLRGKNVKNRCKLIKDKLKQMNNDESDLQDAETWLKMLLRIKDKSKDSLNEEVKSPLDVEMVEDYCFAEIEVGGARNKRGTTRIRRSISLNTQKQTIPDFNKISTCDWLFEEEPVEFLCGVALYNCPRCTNDKLVLEDGILLQLKLQDDTGCLDAVLYNEEFFFNGIQPVRCLVDPPTASHLETCLEHLKERIMSCVVLKHSINKQSIFEITQTDFSINTESIIKKYRVISEDPVQSG